MIEFFLSNHRISYQLLLFYYVLFYITKIKDLFYDVQSIVLQTLFVYHYFIIGNTIFLSILLL